MTTITKKKSWLVLLFSCLLVFSSACGSNANTTKNEEAAEAVNLTIWHAMSGPIGQAFEKMVNDYNETAGVENGIKITPVYQGTEITSKIKLAAQTNDTENMPDIGQIVGSDIPTILKLPFTAKSESYITGETSKISKGDFYPSMLRAFTYQNELGVPISTSTLMLYYNEDALKEAGFDGPPATMDEMTEYIKALTVKEGNNVTRYGLNMQTARYHMVNFIVSQSPDSFVGDNEGGRTAPMTQVTIGEDGTLRNFLTKLDDWVQTGGYKFIEDNTNEEFATGLNAMAIMSSSRINTIKGLVGDSFEWNTAFIPKVNADDTSGASVGGSSLVMFNRGDEKKLAAAWNFIEYASSAEVQAEFSQATGYIPANVATENLDTMKEFYAANPQFKAALDQMKHSNPNAQEPFDLVNWEIDGKVKGIVQLFCEGKLSLDETVKNIVDSYNSALDEYHKANS